MSRLIIGLCTTIVLVVGLNVEPARAGCTKDLDCKGDRVCENGECVSDRATSAQPVSVVSKCTMDTDCGGDLICVGGECAADAAPSAASEPALVACRRDTDCKHDRVCEKGECVSYVPAQAAPSPAPAPVAPPPEGPSQNQPQPVPAVSTNALEMQDQMSRKRAGRGLLVSGIIAFVLGGAMQGGWALEECWTTGTNISGYNESCELTTLGSSLVIGGFILLGVGTVAIIIGAVLLSKAKKALRQRSTLHLSLAPYVDLRSRSSGLGLGFRF